jgi:hypothetical protein
MMQYYRCLEVVKICKAQNVTHYVLIFGYEGIVKMPIGIIYKYIQNAHVSPKENGGFKHYHIRIGLKDHIYLFNTKEEFILDQYYIYDSSYVDEVLLEKDPKDILAEAKSFKNYEIQFGKSNTPRKYRKESKAQKRGLPSWKIIRARSAGLEKNISVIKAKGPGLLMSIT